MNPAVLDALEVCKRDPDFSPPPAVLTALQAQCEEGADVAERLAQLHRAFVVFASQKESQGDNVKPLAQIQCSADSMWRLLTIAHTIRASHQSKEGDSALVVGITACAGAGKSTLVQALKLILTDVLDCGHTEEVSLDDFLSSQQERRESGIKSRWDINSTNEQLADKTLRGLVQSDVGSEVHVPCFCKGRDEREDKVTYQRLLARHCDW